MVLFAVTVRRMMVFSGLRLSLARGPQSQAWRRLQLGDFDRCLALGYRKTAAMLRNTLGQVVNDKRGERNWRQEGLNVPPRQP